MIPYCILIFVPILCSLIRVNGRALLKTKNAMILFFALLFLMLALRAENIGRDLVNYKYYFKTLSGMDWGRALSEDLDPAYIILNKFTALFTKDFQWLLAAVALITVVPIAYTYIHDSENTALTIALFINMSTFIMLFSGLRQAIAVSLGMIAYEFTKRNKLLPYFIIVILAFFFHKSSFMLLFMYPLYHMKLTKKIFVLIIPLLILIFIFNRRIFEFADVLMHDLYSVQISYTGAYMQLVLFILFAVFSFLVSDESKVDPNINGLRNFLLLSVVVQIFASLHPLVMRLNYYYIIFIPLLIPKIISISSVKWAKPALIAKVVMILFFLGYFIIAAPAGNALDTFPYHFFWEGSL